MRNVVRQVEGLWDIAPSFSPRAEVRQRRVEILAHRAQQKSLEGHPARANAGSTCRLPLEKCHLLHALGGKEKVCACPPGTVGLCQNELRTQKKKRSVEVCF